MLIPGFLLLLSISAKRFWKYDTLVSEEKLSGLFENQKKAGPYEEEVKLKLAYLAIPFIPNEGQLEQEVKF